MPGAAEIAGLVLLLADFEDLLVVLHALDEIVDLQLAETPAERYVLIRSEMLIAEEDHLVVDQRPADFAITASSRFSDKSTPEISAPSAPETGWTWIVR
jgi:hypothetical protein